MSTMHKASTYRVGDDWAITVDIGTEQASVEQEKDPIALHYVIDNSGSMGRMTTTVRDIFSNMIDTVATAPCSLTVFHTTGKQCVLSVKTILSSSNPYSVSLTPL
eukprot:scaffold18356_cov103-Cylindrotheca_fusiformis.AAC.1